MLDDQTFLQFARGFNPGSLTTLPHHDHSDMAGNLVLLYTLVVGYRARNILEIGTADGTSTLALLKGAFETDGRVLSLDAQDCPCAHALVQKYDLGSRWSFRQGDSHQVLPTLQGQFDFILVDGDHTYEGAKRDILDSARLLTEGGLMLIHDCLFARDGNSPGTAKAILDLVDSEWQGIVLPFSCNMGLFQRKAPVHALLHATLRNAGF